ncbi:MAG: hypothetical protein ACYCSF_13725 [Acidimicrobiales bacterium]
MAGSMFDEYVMVDWSASTRPSTGRDSIWICRGRRGGRRGDLGALETVNPPTRAQAEVQLRKMIEVSLAVGHRLLVGFDFPLALSKGYGASCTVVRQASPGSPFWLAWWEWLARELSDDAGGEPNRNDRFVVADRLNCLAGTRYFWGRPLGHSYQSLVHLPARDVDVPGLAVNPCPRLRLCEELAGQGIKSGWQLFGGVTVGSQMVTGLPRVAALRACFDPGTVVAWPFEIRWVDSAPVVVAEIWPSLFALDEAARSALAASEHVRDEVQVRRAVKACAAADRTGLLQGWLTPSSTACTPALLQEEGWILGVPG